MLRARRAKGPSWPSAPRSHKELDVQKARVKTSHSARSFWTMARRFGYSRVSTSDQDWSLQLEALTKAGVDDRDIFREKASGAKRDRTEFPFAWRTRMDETGMVGVAGMEIGSVLVRASPSLSLIGGPSSTRYCRHGRTPADCGRRPSWSTLGRFPDARASRRPL